MKLPHEKIKAALLLTICVSLTCCAWLVPKYQRPQIETPAWRGPEDVKADEIQIDWWKKFGSPELNNLTELALKNNTTIESSIERIKQAQATAGITDAARYPNIGLNGNYARTRTDRTKFADGIVNSYTAGLSVSYQLDLFGRYATSSYSAEEHVRGTEFDHDALRLVVASEVARLYAQILSTADRLAIANQNLEIEKHVMTIIQARYDAGRIAGLELAQQKTAVANTQTSIISLIQLQDSQMNQLAVYTGQPPQNFKITGNTLTGFIIPSIAPIQPKELLERRPDIKSAESSLMAANIDIGTARASYFPTLGLTYGPSIAATPANFPAVMTTGLVGSISQTIFDAGAIGDNVERSQFRKSELEYAYIGVILGAYQEVQNAFAAIRSAEDRNVTLQVAVDEAKKAYQIAGDQYKNGSIDFQALLDSQRTLFAAQDAFVQLQFDRISSTIDLYKALGGGWREAR